MASVNTMLNLKNYWHLTLMTDEVITTTPDKDVEEIVSVMLDQHLKNVPVVDKEYRLIGILSRRDIIKLIAKDN